jgi:hypothetical protein
MILLYPSRRVRKMAGTLDEYKRLFREATVADQMKLFKLHIAIYLVVNIIWLVLNATGSIKIDPIWAVYYSPVGWGLLVIVHYWFFVRGAENLCRMREEMVEAKVK